MASILQIIKNGDFSNYDKYIDRLVLPGMVLQLVDLADPNILWCTGPGLIFVPPVCLENKKSGSNCTSYIFVRQFGVLRCRHTESKITSNQNKCQRLVWLDRLISTGSSNILLPLTRLMHYCHIAQFESGDRVLGIVTRKMGDDFAVDIGCANPAVLNYLSFEGSSKKNRPDLQAGDVVYAAITKVDLDVEIELSCVDEAGKASGMGILGRHEPGTVGNAFGSNGGIILYCSQELIRRLIKQDEFPLISLLSKVYPFEICLGVNGRIWLNGRSSRETMILSNTIAMADHISCDACCDIAKELC